MGDPPDEPPPIRWGSRRLWLGVSVVELAIILILAAALAHLATHREGDPGKLPERWPPVAEGRWTLQTATEHWRACWNRTKMLEANASALGTELVRLSTSLRQKELDIKTLEGERSVLKNWTRKLEELNIQQREIITHFHQQQKLWSNGGHRQRRSVVWLVLAPVIAGTLLL